MVDLKEKSCNEIIKLYKDKVNRLSELVLDDSSFSKDEIIDLNSSLEEILKTLIKSLKNSLKLDAENNEEPSGIYNSFILKTICNVIPKCNSFIKSHYQTALSSIIKLAEMRKGGKFYQYLCVEDADSDLKDIMYKLITTAGIFEASIIGTLTEALTFSESNAILDIIYTTSLYINSSSIALFRMKIEEFSTKNKACYFKTNLLI